MKNFDSWNGYKKEIDSLSLNKNFSEREVWFLKMGLNIGFEQDGKGDEYLRPVLVFKKFNKNVFIGIPLTKSKKESRFYCTFRFKDENGTAILSQIRLYDSKRLKFRYGKISKRDFCFVKEKFTELIQ